MEELLSLKWNNHRSTFLHILTVLRDKQLYTDATLACDGKFYNVHRLVLSTCSDYFSAMFDKTTTCKNPIIVLKDIKCEDLEALLDYMYLGEVNVRQADLASLIKSAECLRVKGLAVPDDEPATKRSSRENSKRSESSGHSPPSKRKRREGQDGRDDVRPSSNSTRSKSPLSHSSRLSPSQESRLSSPPSQDRPSSSRDKSSNSNMIDVNNLDTAVVKQELDEPAEIIPDTFDISDDGFKEEASDDHGGGDDIPDFLEDSNSSYSQSYPGPSYQQDLQSWQGDQGFSDLGYSGQSQDGAQNTSGGPKNPYGVDNIGYVSVIEPIVQKNLMGHFQSASTSSSSPQTTSMQMQNVGPLHSIDGSAVYDSSAQYEDSSASCFVCGKVFKGNKTRSAANLRQHLQIHADLRPFRCPMCPKSFNRRTHLRSHMRVHVGRFGQP